MDKLKELLKTKKLFVTPHAMDKARKANIQDEKVLLAFLTEMSGEFHFFSREDDDKFAKYGSSQLSVFYYYCPYRKLMFTLTVNERKNQVVVITVTDKRQKDDVHKHGYVDDPEHKLDF